VARTDAAGVPGRPPCAGPRAATRWAINGKFCAQRLTGVQRVASELVRALDSLVLPGEFALFCPPGARLPDLRHIRVREVGPCGLPLHLWEQVCLPWATRDMRLLNLSGSAPALARRQACLLHDAAVFDRRQAYTATFVWWYRWLFRRLAERADLLFTVSCAAQARLRVWLAVSEERLPVLLNGADHLDCQDPEPGLLQEIDMSRGYLLAVGSANPNKNIAMLLEAYARLPAGRPDLLLAGGVNRGVFKRRRTVDPQGVRRLGNVDDATLVALYRNAIALVFPSLYEGFGLPPLEAMRQGCPVVASLASAIPEVCGDAALYFDPTDVAGLSLALKAVLDRPDLRQDLRQRGLNWSRRFVWADSAKRLLDALEGREARA